jgi:hypothetical protein
MVETFENALTADDIVWFKSDLAALIDVDPVDRPYSVEDSLRIYGQEITNIDRRHILQPGDEAFRRMGDILYRYVPRGTFFYMAYQRQYLPHQLHVDGVYPTTDLNYAKSAIIPLDENINGVFKTVIWDRAFLTNDDLQQYFKEFIADNNRFPVISTVSQTQEVNHCWAGTPSIVDTWLLDGVYNYQLGSIGMFDRTHVHCSSNWVQHRLVDQKDIILLHIG